MTRSPGAPGGETARIAGLFAARIAAAKSELTVEMNALGLTPGQGWRIHEEIVGTADGPSMRLRPIHRTEDAPETLVIVVSLR